MVKRWLKRLLPDGWRLRARRLGRVRWMTKLAVVRANHASVRRWWRFVLLDPEIDSFTYAIANRDELAAVLGELLDRPIEEMRVRLDETDADPLLERARRQPLRRRWWVKSHPPLHGILLAHWAIIRTLKPARVVETGVLDGMGTTVILAALERNAREQAGGELVSVDVLRGAGALVPSWLRGRWTLVIGDSVSTLGQAVAGEPVGYFTSDSLRDPGHIAAELGVVLANATDAMIASTVWGDLPVFEDDSLRVIRFQDKPVDHFWRGRTLAFARPIQPGG